MESFVEKDEKMATDTKIDEFGETIPIKSIHRYEENIGNMCDSILMNRFLNSERRLSEELKLGEVSSASRIRGEKKKKRRIKENPLMDKFLRSEPRLSADLEIDTFLPITLGNIDYRYGKNNAIDQSELGQDHENKFDDQICRYLGEHNELNRRHRNNDNHNINHNNRDNDVECSQIASGGDGKSVDYDDGCCLDGIASGIHNVHHKPIIFDDKNMTDSDCIKLYDSNVHATDNQTLPTRLNKEIFLMNPNTYNMNETESPNTNANSNISNSHHNRQRSASISADMSDETNDINGNSSKSIIGDSNVGIIKTNNKTVIYNTINCSNKTFEQQNLNRSNYSTFIPATSVGRTTKTPKHSCSYCYNFKSTIINGNCKISDLLKAKSHIRNCASCLDSREAAGQPYEKLYKSNVNELDGEKSENRTENQESTLESISISTSTDTPITRATATEITSTTRIATAVTPTSISLSISTTTVTATFTPPSISTTPSSYQPKTSEQVSSGGVTSTLAATSIATLPTEVTTVKKKVEQFKQENTSNHSNISRNISKILKEPGDTNSKSDLENFKRLFNTKDNICDLLNTTTNNNNYSTLIRQRKTVVFNRNFNNNTNNNNNQNNFNKKEYQLNTNEFKHIKFPCVERLVRIYTNFLENNKSGDNLIKSNKYNTNGKVSNTMQSQIKLNNNTKKNINILKTNKKDTIDTVDVIEVDRKMHKITANMDTSLAERPINRKSNNPSPISDEGCQVGPSPYSSDYEDNDIAIDTRKNNDKDKDNNSIKDNIESKGDTVETGVLAKTAVNSSSGVGNNDSDTERETGLNVDKDKVLRSTSNDSALGLDDDMLSMLTLKAQQSMADQSNYTDEIQSVQDVDVVVKKTVRSSSASCGNANSNSDPTPPVNSGRRMTLTVTDIPLRPALLPLAEPNDLPDSPTLIDFSHSSAVPTPIPAGAVTAAVAEAAGASSPLATSPTPFTAAANASAAANAANNSNGSGIITQTAIPSKVILEERIVEIPEDKFNPQANSRRESAQSCMSDYNASEYGGVRYVRTPSVVVSDYSDDVMCGITLEEIEYFRAQRMRRRSSADTATTEKDDAASDVSAASSCSNLYYCGSTISALDGADCYVNGTRMPLDRKISDCSTCSTLSVDDEYPSSYMLHQYVHHQHEMQDQRQEQLQHNKQQQQQQQQQHLQQQHLQQQHLQQQQQQQLQRQQQQQQQSEYPPQPIRKHKKKCKCKKENVANKSLEP